MHTCTCTSRERLSQLGSMMLPGSETPGVHSIEEGVLACFFSYLARPLMGPLQHLSPAHSGARDAVHLWPTSQFLLLVSFQLVVGVVMFVVGLSAFTYTPSYHVGSFWAGFIVSSRSVPRFFFVRFNCFWI